MTAGQKAVIAWGRLFRISLLPTALADIFAGFALGGLSTGEVRLTGLLFLSSACIYHGSMALNDWADFHEDTELRPDRPLPSGQIKPLEALWCASILILLGLIIALAISTPLGAWMAGISSLAIGYNIWLRGRVSGPLCLGLCRAMHLAAPIILVAPEALSEHLWILIGYGVYVFCLSSLARMEAAPDANLQRFSQIHLAVIATAFAAPLTYSAVELEPARRAIVTLLGLGGALTLLAECLRPGNWDPERVQGAVGKTLRLLLIYTAAAALTGPQPYAWIAAALILCGYPIAHSLRRVFPPS